MSADDKELLINEHSPECSSKNSSGDDASGLNGVDIEAQIHHDDVIAGQQRDSDGDDKDFETEEEEEEYESYSDDDNEDDQVTLGSKLKKTNKLKKTGFSIQNDDDGDEIRIVGKRKGSTKQLRTHRSSSRSSVSMKVRNSRAISLRSRSQSFKKKHTIGNRYRGPICVGNKKLTAQEKGLHNRVKLYNRIDNLSNSNRLTVPAHVIPLSFYSIIPVEPGVKQGSLVTIFAIGNLMIGTSSLTMPWAIQQAGLLMGLFLILFMCALACYTCLVIVNLTLTYEANLNGGKPADFSDVCAHYLGPIGKWTAVICSMLALVGAMFAYWILMTNFLYNDVAFIVDSIQSNSGSHADDYKECICIEGLNSSFYYTCFRESENSSGLMPFNTNSGESDVYKKVWDQTNTVPFFLLLLVAPLINFKSPTFFTKFNSLGTISVIYVICFLIMKACAWGINVKELDYPFEDQSSVPLFGSQFASLSGIAMLAFFSHNAAVTVLRNQRNPKNNTRDVILGYMVGLSTYMCSGFIFYLSYPLNKSCIEQNLLDNFLSSDLFSFIGRIFLFFQMLAVFPLLAFVVRFQFYHSFFHQPNPSYPQIIALNLATTILCSIVAFVIPNIGTVTRFSGAIAGALYVSILPCLGIMQRQRSEGKLTVWSVLLNGSICVIGVSNFIAQFFVS